MGSGVSGWAQTYVMHPGSRLLDASVLVMPLVRFAGPTDPRFLSTLDRIGTELASDSLVYRYAITGHDGIDGGEGTFNLCSFWYVEALTRAGRVREARTTAFRALRHPPPATAVTPRVLHAAPAGLATLGLLVILVLLRDALWRGPVTIPQVTVDWLLDTPVDRGRLLRPGFWLSAALAALAGAAVGIVPAAVLVALGLGGRGPGDVLRLTGASMACWSPARSPSATSRPPGSAKEPGWTRMTRAGQRTCRSGSSPWRGGTRPCRASSCWWSRASRPARRPSQQAIRGCSPCSP